VSLRKILPSYIELLGNTHVSRRQQEVLQSFSQLFLPIQQFLFGENLKRNCWKLAFLVFHGQDQGSDGQILKFFNGAESLMFEVKVNVGASESKSLSHNPLLAGLANHKTANSLNGLIFTARMFSVIKLP
jgi:hypothetical protein